MRDETGCGGYFALAIIVVCGWFWLGDPARDIRRLFGQQTYEDRVAELTQQFKGKAIGEGGDQWLVKHGISGAEKVAVFFGYWSDFDACYEFATMYMERYPADTYSCEFAN